MRKLILAFLAVAGCSSNGGVCPAVFCPLVPSVILHLVDATGAPVPGPTEQSVPIFFVDGVEVGAGCASTNTDAGACVTWDLTVYGPHTIHITFPGYQPADLGVNPLGPSQGCCPGPIEVVEKTVTLTKQ